MAACLSRRANAGFFISLSWFGLPGARCCRTALPCRPAHAHVCQLLCLSCRDDGGCRQGKPSGLRSLPCSRQQNTISIQQRHCDFFFHLMPCLCSLSFSFAFVMELDRLQVMPILPNTCTSSALGEKKMFASLAGAKYIENRKSLFW